MHRQINVLRQGFLRWPGKSKTERTKIGKTGPVTVIHNVLSILSVIMDRPEYAIGFMSF